MLAAADITGLVAAFLLAVLLTPTDTATTDRWGWATELLLFVVLLPAWIGVARLHGLYRRDEERADYSTADDLVGVLHLVTLGTWLFVVGAWATGAASPSVPKLVLFWALAITFVTLARVGARALSRRRLTYLQNTVIVGAGSVGQLVAHKVRNHPEYGINLVGFVDERPRERRPGLPTVPLLGTPGELRTIVRRYAVERVVVSFSDESQAETVARVRSIKDLDVQIDIVPRLFELVGPAAVIHSVEGIPLIGLPPLRLSRTAEAAKRAFDAAVAAAGLVVLSPLLALVALAIKLDSPGPVFFRQPRVGAGGHVFRIYKLRTMCLDAEKHKASLAHLNKHAARGGDPRMFKIEGDPRVTRIGAILRRYSLDELPQLLNVVKGEMSLVGPRPLITDEDEHVNDWARTRLDLKPGITGLWQVLGRSAIPFEEMIRLDYLYVTTWSLWNDCRLLLRTLPVVVRGVEG
jgi:exopolysaccharide biosynthesis polyprenyl glycosylphosphotransferase